MDFSMRSSLGRLVKQRRKSQCPRERFGPEMDVKSDLISRSMIVFISVQDCDFTI